MKTFLTDDFLLLSDFARRLYHDYAAHLPILDYHNHLPPQEIAENRIFENISQVWLAGDHYKWRAMRALGIDENYITGTASDKEKFLKWAQTVPYTVRNPLYTGTPWSCLAISISRSYWSQKMPRPSTSERPSNYKTPAGIPWGCCKERRWNIFVPPMTLPIA